LLVDSELTGETARERALGTQAVSKAEDAGAPVMFHAVRMVETAPASSFPDAAAVLAASKGQPGVELNELNDVQVKQSLPGPGPTMASGAPASILALPPSPAPLFTFEGNGVGNNAPPDTNGAIGPKHYVQQVNLTVGVYDKFTHTLIGSRFLLSSLFAPLGGICATTDDGDPVVLYDKLADRWILSQFGFVALNTPPYHQCMAISKTGDPKGAYYAYDFQLPGNEFPDYPKLGTWPDAYYMTTNQFFMGGGFDGGGVFAFERAKMLVGNPVAGAIYGNLNSHRPEESSACFLRTSTADATPDGAPNVFAYPTNTLFGDPADGVRLFNFTVGVPFGTGASFDEGRRARTRRRFPSPRGTCAIRAAGPTSLSLLRPATTTPTAWTPLPPGSCIACSITTAREPRSSSRTSPSTRVVSIRTPRPTTGLRSATSSCRGRGEPIRSASRAPSPRQMRAAGWGARPRTTRETSPSATAFRA
jgi:hypothetical protein